MAEKVFQSYAISVAGEEREREVEFAARRGGNSG
jgi:hypothetical protein